MEITKTMQHQKQRDNFLKVQAKKHHMTVAWVKETLAKHFETFNITRIQEYEDTLTQEVYLVRTEQKRAELKKKYAKQFGNAPCGIPSCAGHLIVGANGTVCDIGDIRHVLAVSLARHINGTPEEALNKLNVMWEEYDQRLKEAYEEWRNGTTAPQKDQGETHRAFQCAPTGEIPDHGVSGSDRPDQVSGSEPCLNPDSTAI